MLGVGAGLAAVVAGYLLGTIPNAVLVTRLATRGRVDIRETGSGNPGGFNTIRSVGKVWGAAVILLDGGKAVLAALLGWLIAGDAGAYLGATAAIAGHVAPVWTGFRGGGKGVAAAGGSILAVFPVFFPVELVVLLVAALVIRKAEPAMLVGMVAWVVGAVVWTLAGWGDGWGPGAGPGLIAASVVGAGLVIAKFRLTA
jgi:glycerol-3-phosphate acyltransferase PlsY